MLFSSTAVITTVTVTVLKPFCLFLGLAEHLLPAVRPQPGRPARPRDRQDLQDRQGKLLKRTPKNFLSNIIFETSIFPGAHQSVV